MIRAKIFITTTFKLEGNFEAETLAEAVAVAEMEARNHSEFDCSRTLVISTEKIDDPE
jgi:hypothetical protein